MKDSGLENNVKQKRPRGRPKVGPLPQVAMKLSQTQLDKVNAIAEQDGISRSAVFRKAVDLLVKLREGKPEAAAGPRLKTGTVPAGAISMDAVRAAFAACAAHFPLPEGVSVNLDAERLADGRWKVRIEASDSTCLFWAEEARPHASATYRPLGGGVLNAATVLSAFADKLDGLSGRPVKTMPDGLKSLCAGAVRQALGTFASAAAEEEEEDAEDAGPKP